MTSTSDFTRDLPLDGQLRFVHRAARGSRTVASLILTTLLGMPGIIKANANAKTGEVFVVFASDRTTPHAILLTLDRVLDESFVASLTAPSVADR